MYRQKIKEIIYLIILKVKNGFNFIKNSNQIARISYFINNNPNSKKLIIITLLNILLLIIVFFLLSLTKLIPTTKKPSIPLPFKVSPTPTPTPVPLVQGPQTFSIGMKKAIPEMYEVWFNTVDPKKGTQAVKLKIRDKIGKITFVRATVTTERLKKFYRMSLSEGTTSDGVWSGSWKVNDNYNKNFVIRFEASDDKGHSSLVDVTIR